MKKYESPLADIIKLDITDIVTVSGTTTTTTITTTTTTITTTTSGGGTTPGGGGYGNGDTVVGVDGLFGPGGPWGDMFN